MKRKIETLQSINWKHLLIELLVVFIGVYGAFQLDSYRSSREDLQHRITYFKAFELILDNYLQTVTILKTDIDTILADLNSDSSLELNYLHEIDFTNTIYIVQSVFSSDRFSGVHSEFMMNLEIGANLIRNLEERIKGFRQTVNHAKMNGTSQSNEFRIWSLGELEYISKRLSRLKSAIEQGALPETREMIRVLESD